MKLAMRVLKDSLGMLNDCMMMMVDWRLVKRDRGFIRGRQQYRFKALNKWPLKRCVCVRACFSAQCRKVTLFKIHIKLAV